MSQSILPSLADRTESTPFGAVASERSPSPFQHVRHSLIDEEHVEREAGPEVELLQSPVEKLLVEDAVHLGRQLRLLPAADRAHGPPDRTRAAPQQTPASPGDTVFATEGHDLHQRRRAGGLLEKWVVGPGQFLFFVG